MSSVGEETVPCKFCGTSTTRTATKRCDNCWEVSTRVQYMNIDVLESIMAEMRPEFLRAIRAQGFRAGSDDERFRAAVRPGQGDMGG